MIENIKKKLYNFLIGLGLPVADNKNIQGTFPQIFLRTNGHRWYQSKDVRYDMITLTLDIFSNYSGEKEILEISEKIGNEINKNFIKDPMIISVQQNDLKILDDSKTGVIRKHGVLTYDFTCVSFLEQEDESDE